MAAHSPGHNYEAEQQNEIRKPGKKCVRPVAEYECHRGQVKEGYTRRGEYTQHYNGPCQAILSYDSEMRLVSCKFIPSLLLKNDSSPWN
jgi:hypothetical protein